MMGMQVLTGKAVAPQSDVETTRVTKAWDATRLLKQRDPAKTYASAFNHRAAQRHAHEAEPTSNQKEKQNEKGHQGPGKSYKIDNIHLVQSLKSTLIKLKNLLVKKHSLPLRLENLTYKLDDGTLKKLREDSKIHYEIIKNTEITDNSLDLISNIKRLFTRSKLRNTPF